MEFALFRKRASLRVVAAIALVRTRGCRALPRPAPLLSMLLFAAILVLSEAAHAHFGAERFDIFLANVRDVQSVCVAPGS